MATEKDILSVDVEKMMYDLRVIADENRLLRIKWLEERIKGLQAQETLAQVLRKQAEADLEGLKSG